MNNRTQHAETVVTITAFIIASVTALILIGVLIF